MNGIPLSHRIQLPRTCRSIWSHLLVLLAAVGMSSSSGAVAADSPTLRVLCYNIHYGQGTDGKYDVERLARVISRA
ncbi:MAG: hypothetical protein VB858_11600, partial [Planctomycetaceae bacterium]